jgi:RNA polymerase sigma factor (sigma-70 family)
MAQSDKGLFRRWVTQRDADAFAELVSRHSGMVHAACKRVLQSTAHAEEVAQECFLRLAQQNSDIASPAGWLHRVAVRASLDRLRAETRRRQREVRYSEDHAETKTENTEWEAILPVVDEAIDELPDELRVPVILRFMEGRTHAYIGKELGVSRTAVQKRINKALGQIRTFLGKRGITATLAALATTFAIHLKANAAPLSLIAALGRRTLARMGPAQTVPASNLLVKGVVAMLSKKAVASLAILAVGALSALLAVHQFRGDSSADKPEDVPPKASAPSETGAPASASAVPSPVHESDEHTVTSGQQGPSPDETDSQKSNMVDISQDEGVQEDQTGLPASVAGSVQDEDAYPVAGVHIWVEVKGAATSIARAFDTETDGDGQYVISDVSASGSGTIYAKAEGYLMQNRSLGVIREGASLTDVDFTLSHARYLVRGTVVTELDQPVPEAEVSLVAMEEPPPVAEWSRGIGSRFIFDVTTPKGEFEIAVPDEALCTFSVVKEGFAEGRFGNIPTGTEDARFVLTGFGTIAGRVTRSDETPAAGFIVAVTAKSTYDPDNPEYYDPQLSQRRFEQRVVIDDEGFYSLEDLSPLIAYDLGVFDESEGRLRRGWRRYPIQPLAYEQKLHVEPGEVLPVDFQLLENPYARISGHVKDAVSAEPLQGFGMHCGTHAPYKFLAWAKTDRRGYFELEFTLNEESSIYVGGSRDTPLGGAGVPLWRAEDMRPLGLLPMSPGDEITLEVVAAAAFEIAVRVVDGNGQPVPGMGVGAGFVRDDGQWDYGGGRCILTDESGQCVCKGLPPNRSYFVWAQRPQDPQDRIGGNPIPLAQYGPIEGELGETVLEVVLIVGILGGLEGVVADAEGNPLANVPVVITAPSPGSAQPQSVHVQTRADGWFTMVHALMPGSYPKLTVSATVEGMVLQGCIEAVEITEGVVVDAGTILLQPLLEPTEQ